jgi:hypothetical protein
MGNIAHRPNVFVILVIRFTGSLALWVPIGFIPGNCSRRLKEERGKRVRGFILLVVSLYGC